MSKRTTDIKFPITHKEIGNGTVVFYASTYRKDWAGSNEHHPIPKYPENDHLLEEGIMGANRQNNYRTDSWRLKKIQCKLVDLNNEMSIMKFKQEGVIYEV
ncbi:hypothetical protein_gp189 [Bacillus phage vB_BceM_WH1]|nr:hypothetical protein_gp189 [Bacillus phage vB_BceM_WH1]